MRPLKIFITIIFFFVLRSSGFTQVAVITHKSVPFDTLTQVQLLDFYTGDIKKWGEDGPVVVFDLKPKTEVKKRFYKFLGKSSSRMKSIWLKKLLSGEGDPPEAVKSEDEMVKKVKETPGAIGFVSKSKVNGEVKTLLIVPNKNK